LTSLGFSFIQCTSPHKPNRFKDSVASEDETKEKEKSLWGGRVGTRGA